MMATEKHETVLVGDVMPSVGNSGVTAAMLVILNCAIVTCLVYQHLSLTIVILNYKLPNTMSRVFEKIKDF